MLTQDHLNLRLIRLKPSEQWKKEGDGVSFLFPRAGAGHYLKGNLKQPLGPGDVLVINGDNSAKICSSSNGEFAFSGFTVKMEHLFPLFASIEISLLQSVIDQVKGSRFYPASSPLAGECHKLIQDIPPQLNLDHRGHLLRLASVVLNEEFKAAHTNRMGFVRQEDHMIQVFESLSVDDMLTLSVPELAKRFSCSRRHLNRLFHQYFGFSVAALRMEMRLMKAVSLLRDSDAKVINVAEQCGFNHLGLFNTCFRKRFGTSPGKWRKAVTQIAEQPTKRGEKSKEIGCPLRMTGLCPWPGEAGQEVSTETKNRKGEARSSHRKGRECNGLGDQESCSLKLAVAVSAGQKPAKSLAFQIRAQQ